MSSSLRASSLECDSLERGLLGLLLGRLQRQLVLRLAELLVRVRDGLRDREFLDGGGSLEFRAQTLDLGILLRGRLLRLLGGLRLSERDLGLLGLLGLGQAGVELLLELHRAHLLHDVGVLRLVDGEHGPAVRALDLICRADGCGLVHVELRSWWEAGPTGGAIPQRRPACGSDFMSPDSWSVEISDAHSSVRLISPLISTIAYCERLDLRYVGVMSTSSPLLIDLAGVARLADVQRPVASVWRTRFASSTDPFPPAVTEKGGRALFDAMSIAQWLARTDHGNNPDAVADAAASATPTGFDVADASHVAAVDALLALRAVSGEPVGGSEHRRTSAAGRRRRSRRFLSGGGGVDGPVRLDGVGGPACGCRLLAARGIADPRATACRDQIVGRIIGSAHIRRRSPAGRLGRGAHRRPGIGTRPERRHHARRLQRHSSRTSATTSSSWCLRSRRVAASADDCSATGSCCRQSSRTGARCPACLSCVRPLARTTTTADDAPDHR